MRRVRKRKEIRKPTEEEEKILVCLEHIHKISQYNNKKN